LASDNKPTNDPDEIPRDAKVIKQVQYAWIWSSLPWVLVVAVLYGIGFFPEPLMTLAVLVAIMAPRFMMWRGTRYILTSDQLIYQRGKFLGGSSRFQIPLSKLADAQARYGAFGRAVGYQTVDIVFQEGGVASLKYISILDDLADELRRLIVAAGGGPDSGDGGEPPADPQTPNGDRPAAD